VVELGKEYEGQIKFVRLDVDHGESRAAVSRYGVRATPTFVLLNGQGQIRGNVPGWPGYQNITGAFEQLLAGG
jgi:thioredoxin-related protein